MSLPPLPVLPTMGVGSAAAPGWLSLARHQIRDGALGSADIAELFEDATRLAVADQIEAGIDILSDGELRRQRFVYEMYDRLNGLKRAPPARRLGVPGYDMAPHFIAEERLSAPRGLGVAEEFASLRALAPDRHLKAAFPGALTFALGIKSAPRGRDHLIDELVGLVRAEIAALAAAGCRHIQLDEPSFAEPPLGITRREAASIVNRCTEGHEGSIAVHICFGNNAGRPLTDRSIARLLPELEALHCRQLVLEFANREMSEIELLAGLARKYEIAAGVIDVKSFHVESAEQVARRIERALNYVPLDKLTITADCGFSATPRALAMAKMRALVQGAELVRNRVA